MKLNGSCHCGAVCFEVETRYPYPFNVCYCSICRKTAGAGGFAVNLSADFQTLNVSGEDHIRVYHAVERDDSGEIVGESQAGRRFCGTCGSPLWLWDPRWPELVHPHASAIDTDLPSPPEHTHLMLDSKAAWVEPALADGDKSFAEYPEESIADWHKRLKLEMP